MGKTVVNLLIQALANSFSIFLNTVPWLLLGIIASSLIRALVTEKQIGSILKKIPGGTPVSVFGAAVIGATIPMCSCKLIPILLILLASGISIGVVIAFSVSSPMISVTSFILISGSISPRFGIFAYLAAIIIGIVSGLFAALIFSKKDVRFQKTKEKEGPKGFRNAFVEYTKRQTIGIFKLFIPFIFLAGFLQAIVTGDIVSTFLGQGPLSVVFAALIGLPLYVTCTSSSPLLIAMLNKGVAESVVMAFFIAGAGTSIPAIGAVVTILRGRVVIYYILSCLLGAIAVSFVYGFLF
ncbi:MAG: permease [Candidatus Thermoplasmatota archaeon]|nr:permease [Candidatus Thermoplasmatota archaeon]